MGSDFLNGAAYIRVSTDQQMELSPDSQLEAALSQICPGQSTLLGTSPHLSAL